MSIENITMDLTETTMVDVVKPQLVEIMISQTGEEVWVNIDGICRLRAKQCKHVVVFECNRILIVGTSKIGEGKK